MDKEFVPYELSLDMKELGFDEPCFTFYPKEGKMGFDGKYHSIKEGYRNSTVNDIWIKRYKKDFECVAAPTFSQAFRWFREKHKLLGVPQYFTGGFYCYTVNDMKDTKESNRLFSEFKTPEEAELGCLLKLIEIVKNK